MSTRHAITSNPIRVGVVGLGYWGPNLVRNFANHPGTQVTALCDTRPENLARAGRLAPDARQTTSFEEMLALCELAAIATPVGLHYGMAREALARGHHVLVEKPLSLDVREAEELVTLAASNRKILAVDHTFVFAPAIAKLKELVASGDLGEIWYYDSVRINLGLFQHDVDVVADLAPHDFSILDYLFGELPDAVIATGASHTQSGLVDMAHIHLRFPGTLHAHVHVNWLAPVKIRNIIIGGSRRMALFDDTNPAEKVRVYDKGIDVSADAVSVYEALVNYRIGDMYAPRLGDWEALARLVDELVAAIREGSPLRSDGEAGLRCVRLLAAAQASLRAGGERIEMAQASPVRG